jgi:hypothetical protein
VFHVSRESALTSDCGNVFHVSRESALTSDW